MFENELAELKIAVLQTGRSAEALFEAHGDYDDMCKALLGRSSDEAVTYAVLDEEFPASIDPYDVIVITGSRHAVYEDHTWIPRLEALVREAYAKSKKIVGICFGHQIIAQALGGHVEKSDLGFGVGVMEYEITESGDEPKKLALYAWHQDQIVRAPADAKIIARSDFCEIAALQYGDRAISFQAHPEFTKEYIAGLVEDRRDNGISDELADAALVSLGKKVDAQTVRAMLAEFLRA